jgi:RNA recognition motif-containing protein
MSDDNFIPVPQTSDFGSDDMSTGTNSNLFVGNLSYTTTDESLRSLFAQAGNIKSLSIIMDRITGKSRGFGFVEMETVEEAQNAIRMFDNKEFDGRTLRVREARPRQERRPS